MPAAGGVNTAAPFNSSKINNKLWHLRKSLRKEIESKDFFFLFFLNPKLVMREQELRNTHNVHCKQKLGKALISSWEGPDHFRRLLQASSSWKWRRPLWFSFSELLLLHFSGFLLEVLSKHFIASLVWCYHSSESECGKMNRLSIQCPNFALTEISNTSPQWFKQATGRARALLKNQGSVLSSVGS